MCKDNTNLDLAFRLSGTQQRFNLRQSFHHRCHQVNVLHSTRGGCPSFRAEKGWSAVSDFGSKQKDEKKVLLLPHRNAAERVRGRARACLNVPGHACACIREATQLRSIERAASTLPCLACLTATTTSTPGLWFGRTEIKGGLWGTEGYRSRPSAKRYSICRIFDGVHW